MVAARIMSLMALCFARSIASEAPLLQTVEGSIKMPPNSLPFPLTKLSLNGGEYEAYTRLDGSFAFYDVKPGIYLLDVLSPIAMFSQVKVNVPTTADGAIKVLEYKFPGAPKQPALYPIELTPLVKTQYFEARPKMSIIGMLMGNPMMLMMGLMVIGMTVFPKLLGEDVMKEFTEQQTKMQEEMGDASDPMAMFKKILSGEGMDEPKPAASPPAVTSGGATATAKRSKKQRD